VFTKMTNDGDSKTGNDESGQLSNPVPINYLENSGTTIHFFIFL